MLIVEYNMLCLHLSLELVWSCLGVDYLWLFFPQMQRILQDVMNWEILSVSEEKEGSSVLIRIIDSCYTELFVNIFFFFCGSAVVDSHCILCWPACHSCRMFLDYLVLVGFGVWFLFWLFSWLLPNIST